MNETNPLFSKHLALVVDDDAVARAVAIRTLSKLGFEVISADDGETALEQLQEHNPDIILLDVEMERMGGIEACTEIRQTSFGNKPIIMMTAHDAAESIDRAFEAGATDFAMKPINWTLLLHKIKYVMRSQEVLLELKNAEHISGLGNWRQSKDSENVVISEGLGHLLGLKHGETEQPLNYIHPDDRELVLQEIAKIGDNDKMSLTHRMITADNKEIVVQHNAKSLLSFNGESKGALGTIQDITEKETTNRRIQQLAYHDTVTAAFNRSATVDRLNSLVNDEHSNHSFALLYIDIDNFRRINESLGQAVGDILLFLVGERLHEILLKLGYDIPRQFLVRENILEHSSLNLLARMSADEFAIILMDDWHKKNIENIGNTLVKELNHPFDIMGRQLTISASVGSAVYPDHGATADTLSQNANTAMHSVKVKGKNNFKLYDSQLSDVAQKKIQLEEYLMLALERNEFSLAYQPQIDMRTMKLVGAEALLRWYSAGLGIVSPLEFIPLAEEIGLIEPIGNWVLNTACEQLASWQNQGLELQRMAINISIRQFGQDEFVDEVACAIKDSGVDAKNVELEITESLLAVDVASATRKLEELKRLGVEISVDDFGTGYSSLSYLKNFPIDRLKIDQSFVKDIHRDVNDVAITKSIIGLARGLSLGVIAEGVETAEHLAKLNELGCNEAQGYLIGKPMKHSDFNFWYESYCERIGATPYSRAA